jgi:hypothetical protein
MNVVGQTERTTRHVTNWAPIFGEWNIDVENGRVIFQSAPQDARSQFGICVSDVRLTEGEARLAYRQTKGTVDGRLLLGYQSLASDYYTVGLGGYGNAYNIVHYNQNTGWRSVATAGIGHVLQADRIYRLAVRVEGQRIVLEVDGVRVLEHVLDVPLPSGQMGLFAWGDGGAEFSDIRVRQDPGTAFVVMQLSGDRYQELYEPVIQEVAKQFELRAVHAGDLPGPGLIIGNSPGWWVASRGS